MNNKHAWRQLLDAVSAPGNPPVAGLLAGGTGRPYRRAELAESEFLRSCLMPWRLDYAAAA